MCLFALIDCASYPVFVHRLTVSFRASFPRSVALTQLHFLSLTVVSSREDFHLQDRAHAGRTHSQPAKAGELLSRLSLFAGVDLSNLLYLKLLVLKGLHYIAATATIGDTRGAVILGGGCVGRRNRNASRSRRCSGSGCV